jgi:hypothetical protein
MVWKGGHRERERGGRKIESANPPSWLVAEDDVSTVADDRIVDGDRLGVVLDDDARFPACLLCAAWTSLCRLEDNRFLQLGLCSPPMLTNPRPINLELAGETIESNWDQVTDK